MDKRTVYMCPVAEQNRFACLVPNPNCRNRGHEGCIEHALVDPASFAKVEEDARVGRAAIALRDKWRDRIKGDQPTTRKEEGMWRELVATIAHALTKTKEESPYE